MVALEACRLFSQVPPQDLAPLQAVAEARRYPAGAPIFKEGDAGDGLYVVKSGAVQISARLETGERHVFAQILPGHVFGEMAVFDRQPRSASASADQDTEVYFVPRDALMQLVGRWPDVAVRLMQDISQRMRDFNCQYVRRVLETERMALVGRFARAIVHDLKNPLTIIGIAADLACGERCSAENRKMVQDRIRRQIERITSLVNDILDFTRGPQAEAPLTVMDYAPFVASIAEELAPELELKTVTLERENEPTSVRLAMNPRRLSRVFHNLIWNAVDAMPEGGRVRLRFHVTDAEVATEIADTGPGIAPEIADRLFEAFATFGKAKGTGLGLAICQRIVQEHHGRISARNQPGGGAVFAFSLPRSP
jgi:signal transduction histidine kinase